MINRVKKILGIEGVRLALDIPENQSIASGVIRGELKLSSLSKRTVKSIHIRIIETYHRGRSNSKRINDYEIGSLMIDEKLMVKPEKSYAMPFEIPITIAESEMDRLYKKKILIRPLIALARWQKKVKSTFQIQISLEVAGTKLQPTLIKDLKLKK